MHQDIHEIIDINSLVNQKQKTGRLAELFLLFLDVYDANKTILQLLIILFLPSA